MSVFDSFFGFKSVVGDTESDLPSLFPLSVPLEVFVDTDISNVYSKILTDCVERTEGIPTDISSLLWDSCLQSESSLGLISLLSLAMTLKQELFLIYDAALPILRQATDTESAQIKADYKSKNNSDLGIYVSFKHYRRTDIVKIYSGMEYCVVSSMNKMANLSKAIQFKMNDMRSSVGLVDSSVVRSQAKGIANSLARGKDVMMDGNDTIETGKPDISSIKESIAFLDSKRCFYYGMPLSYINGEQTTGISSTGEADTKAVERGLKHYYISVVKPVIEALFDIQTSFKSTDFRQIGSALEAIKTFELVSNDLISQQDKQFVIQKLLDLQKQPE